jgi:hypothetical protein
VLSFWISGTTPSRRWTVENNHIHDNWGGCLDALHLEDSVFRGNLLHDCYSVNLYADNARALRIEGNYIYNSSDKYNRALSGERAHGIAIGTECAPAPTLLQDITVANNLISNTSVGILYARFNGLGYTGIGIYYNVVANPAKTRCGSTLQARRAAWRQLGTPSIVADPQFTASGNGGTDPEGFRLEPGSLALSAGTPVVAVPNDYTCKPRSSTAPSIGIYE